MRYLLILLLTALASSAIRPSSGVRGPERPNVLFIAIDDLNDWTGYLGGHPQASTPNLDRLASRGVAFTQAYCASPICVPSRTAVMSGIPPHVSGITSNIGRMRKILPEVQTLPQRLRAGGYLTMAGGKIFHYPDPASWDHQALPNDGVSLNDPAREDRGLDVPGLEFGPLDVDESLMADHRVSTWVAEQLGRRWDKPFFLACGLVKPHLPWSVPRRFFEQLPLDQVQLPAAPTEVIKQLPKASRKLSKSMLNKLLAQDDKRRAAVQAYLATIAYVDEQLGRVLRALESGPNAENTIVILWSDHGMSMGEKGHWKKSALWEDTTRVPLIFAGPGIAHGLRNSHAVGLIDLYRTTAELCGQSAPDEVAGHSLVPMLSNPDLARPAPVLTTQGREHAIRSDRWRLIRYRDGSEELYDHSVDPNEWSNLAESPEHERLLTELRAYLPEQQAAAKPRAKQRSKRKPQPKARDER